MSSTNRAFIKAYRQDAADPSSAAGPAPASHGPTRAPKNEAAVQTSTSVRDAAYSAFEPLPATSKRPLSSFIGGSASPSGRGSLAESENPNFLQPGTTVASFQWPKVCRTLSLECGAQLDRLVDLFRAQAGAG